jgi:hypothetical protein
MLKSRLTLTCISLILIKNYFLKNFNYELRLSIILQQIEMQEDQSKINRWISRYEMLLIHTLDLPISSWEENIYSLRPLL